MFELLFVLFCRHPSRPLTFPFLSLPFLLPCYRGEVSGPGEHHQRLRLRHEGGPWSLRKRIDVVYRTPPLSPLLSLLLTSSSADLLHHRYRLGYDPVKLSHHRHPSALPSSRCRVPLGHLHACALQGAEREVHLRHALPHRFPRGLHFRRRASSFFSLRVLAGRFSYCGCLPSFSQMIYVFGSWYTKRELGVFLSPASFSPPRLNTIPTSLPSVVCAYGGSMFSGYITSAIYKVRFLSSSLLFVSLASPILLSAEHERTCGISWMEVS
jgi:hypothetical protein